MCGCLNGRRLSWFKALFLAVFSLFLSCVIAGCGSSGSGVSTPTALTINPKAPSTPVGVSCCLNAMLHYDNGVTINVTEKVTWSTADKNIATIDKTGKVTPVKPGTVEISAYYGMIYTVTSLTVTDAVLEQVKVTSKNGTFSTPRTVDLPLAAIGTFSDGTSREVTQDVTWSSSDTAIADVSNKGVVTPVEVGEVGIVASVPDTSIKDEATVTVTDAEVESVTIGSQTGTFSSPVGVPLKLTAQANFSDGTSIDITNKDAVDWQSDSTSIATVSRGVVTPITQGNSCITATFSGVTGSKTIEVTDGTLRSLSIEGDDSTPFQIPITLKAMGIFSDGTTYELTDGLTWSADGDATVMDGVVTPTAVGEATITLQYQGLQATHKVTITGGILESLTIGSTTGSFTTYVGVPLTLTVQANFSDGTSKDITGEDAIGWESSSTDYATVYNGVVDAISVGKADITATFEGISATQNIVITDSVLESIAIEGDDSTPALLPITLKVMGTYSDGSTQEVTDGLTWTAEGDATVLDGEVTPTAAGKATITVTKDELKAEHKVTITDAIVTSLTIGSKTDSFETPVGVPLTLTVQANFSDGTSKDITGQDAITWKSTSTSFATVSNGVVDPIKVGKTEITATFSEVSASQEITITDAVLQSLAIEGDDSTPALLPITLKVMGTYSDGSTQEVTDGLTWTAEGDATVLDGEVTPTAAGKATITVTKDELKAEHKVTITDAIVTSLTIGSKTDSFETPIGVPLDLTVEAVFSDGSTKDITGQDAISWKSASTSYATVSGGTVNPIKKGKAEITATFDEVSASQEITITDAVLQSLAIEGDDSTPLSLPVTLEVMGTYSDGSTKKVTDGLTWSVEEGDATVADGVVTPNAAGEVKISVSEDSVEEPAEHKITVTDAVITAIELSLDSEDPISIGSERQLIAKATLSDGNIIANIAKRDSVVWTSDSTSVATVAIGKVSFSKDAEIGDTVGITASVDVDGTPVSGSIDLTIEQEGALESIELVSASGNFSAPCGGTDTISITGSYTDGRVVEGLDPALFTWTVSGDTFVPSEGSEPESIISITDGTVTALHTGEANIAVAYTEDDSITASHSFTVTDSPLVSIEIEGAGDLSLSTPSMVLQAKGTFADESTSYITTTSEWESSDDGVVTVSAGIVKPVAVGNAYVTCKSGTIESSVLVKVTPAVVTLTSITLSAASSTTVTDTDETVQLVATGHFSDGSTSDLSNEAGWQVVEDSYSIVSAIAGGSVSFETPALVPPGEPMYAVISFKKGTIEAAEPITVTLLIN